MSNTRTLRNIRRDAPEGDRDAPALAPTPVPRSAYEPGLKSKYIPVILRAQTLEELDNWCRLSPAGKEVAAAAVQDAQWGAIKAWLMWGPDGLSNPSPVASLAAFLCSADDRVRLGYPSLSGTAFTSQLSHLSEDTRQEALRVAAETVADWKRAGMPKLIASIEREQKYIAAHFCHLAEASDNLFDNKGIAE